jgi:hypothetical protein
MRERERNREREREREKQRERDSERREIVYLMMIDARATVGLLALNKEGSHSKKFLLLVD